MTDRPLNLSLESLSLEYPKKHVLRGITAQFYAGQIHMLIGENGAGKSSLIKIICGDILPSSGKILLNGREAKIRSPADAIKSGIVCVHQRPLLADGISIIENLRLGAKSFSKAEAARLLEEWLPGVNPRTLVRNCGGDARFFVSLAGALLKNPSLLILDEPSSLLDENQRDFLFARLRGFSKDGMNLIVITHFMDEAAAFGDTITCLSDGKICDKKNAFRALQKEEFSYGDQTEKSMQGSLSLSFEDLNASPKDKPAIRNFSFMAESGKITFIKGLTEDGSETLEDLICGMSDARQSGRLRIEENKAGGRKFHFEIKNSNFTRRKLEKSPFTFGIIPSDKSYRGSNPRLTIQQLLTAGVKNKGRDFRAVQYARTLIEKADVNIQPNDKVSFLSGGMLQRLILERELAKNPDILIFCEPVQGLDTERSARVFENIKRLAGEGKLVIVIAAADLPASLGAVTYRLQHSQALARQ